jgi:hypothetical protein
MLSKCQEDKFNFYFKWIFIFLLIFGIVLFYKDIGKLLSTINMNNLFNIMNLVKNNLDVFLVTIVSLTIMTLVLFNRYNNNTCNETFINGVNKNTVFVSLQAFNKNLKDAKKMKDKYPDRVDMKNINELIEVSASLINKLKNIKLDVLGPMAIYELFQPLLEIYYEQDKGARELSLDLGIQIIVPNRKLEDEYRTRFTKVHYIKDRPLYPQINFSQLYPIR